MGPSEGHFGISEKKDGQQSQLTDGWPKWTAVPFTERNFNLVPDKEVQISKCHIRKTDLFQCQIDCSL